MTAIIEAPPVSESGGAWEDGRIFKAQELDDAWARAKALEAERDSILKAHQELSRAYSRQSVKLARVIQRLYNLRYENPDLPGDVLGEILDIATMGTPDD